jgi:hypothetical protein
MHRFERERVRKRFLNRWLNDDDTFPICKWNNGNDACLFAGYTTLHDHRSNGSPPPAANSLPLAPPPNVQQQQQQHQQQQQQQQHQQSSSNGGAGSGGSAGGGGTGGGTGSNPPASQTGLSYMQMNNQQQQQHRNQQSANSSQFHLGHPMKEESNTSASSYQNLSGGPEDMPVSGRECPKWRLLTQRAL